MFFSKYLCIIFTFLLVEFKTISSITCYYYPLYPTLYTAYSTTCSSSCCSGYPKTIADACCTTTTTSTTKASNNSNTSWITGVIIGSTIGFCCLISITIGIGCAIAEKMRTLKISSNTIYPITIQHQPKLQARPELNDNFYIKLRQERTLNEPPKYDLFIKQPSILNIENSLYDQQLPVIPAPIEYKL